MSAPRRVRTIYSVIASPNRLDILRILNTKGPLSYSELKTLAGFKSKKESGKFAYHLRKLVKQTLISLNRAERKYAVTSLGRLVLNLTRQIEEQSMLESGRLYVRSSRQSMEEFNADKILQSLVNEAEMPVDLAQKIASETEARVYKFQAAYLTAPLIREIVNSILVEHGYEEYRHKLTRLGLPVYDVTQLISKTADGTGSLETVFSKTARHVLSEYAMLTKIPRDVSDAHLSGDLHLSSLGTWSLMPDTVYFDLDALYSNLINLGSKIANVPRLSSVKNFESAMETLIIFAGLLSSEVSREVCLDNVIPYLAKLYAPRSPEEQVRLFSSLLCSLSVATATGGLQRISFRLGEPRKDEDVTAQLELRDSLLKAYARFITAVPRASVNLVVSPGRYLDRRITEGIAAIIAEGGDIALESEGKFTFSGLKIGSIANVGYVGQADGVAVLENLTVNLPRLAYESNKDETYFRAKLALLLQVAVSALSNRREQVKDVMKKGLLPAITQLPVVSSMEDLPIVINLVGLNEAVSNLLSERESANRREISIKILETAGKVASDRGTKLGQRAFVSMIQHEGFERLVDIDSEKYGKSQELRVGGYRAGLTASSDNFENQEALASLSAFSKATNGGVLVNYEFSKANINDQSTNYANIVANLSGKIPFMRLSRNPEICKKCGFKVFGTGRCGNCRSTVLISQAMING